MTQTVGLDQIQDEKAEYQRRAQLIKTRRSGLKAKDPLSFDLSKVGPYHMLWKMLNLKWWQIIYYLVIFIMKNAPAWMMPISLAVVVEIVSHPGKYPIWYLAAFAGLMTVLFAYNIPGHLWYITLISRHIRDMEFSLRGALVRRLQQLSIRFHHKSDSGALQTKVVRDVEAVEQMTKQMTEGLLQSFITILITFGIALYHKPLVAVFYLVATPICVGLIFAFRGSIRKRNHVFRNDMEDVGGRIGEMISMIPVTRAHGLEHTEIKKSNHRLHHLRHSGLQLDKINALFQSSSWVTFQFSLFFAMCCMGLMVYFEYMGITALVLYSTQFTLIVTSVMMLVNMFPILQKGSVSLDSLRDLLLATDMEKNEGKPEMKEVLGDVKIQDVSFSYEQRGNKALENLNLHVFPGECVAFVGESGSGKSTAMSLLVGFFHAQKGRILIDDQDMTQIDLRSWRRNIAVVPQQTIMFSSSLRDNITYGLGRVPEEKVWEVIEAANLKDVVEAMPDGLDSQVGENGVQLSGGQRQRIAIARALIRDPRVIILDEATSALDVISEKQVQEAINRLIKGRTTFIVAHRLSTIRQANRIVVMKDGQCVECGSQEELLAQKGEFSRLKALQS